MNLLNVFLPGKLNFVSPVASFLPLLYRKSPSLDPRLYPVIAPPVPKAKLPIPPPPSVPSVAPSAPPRYPPRPFESPANTWLVLLLPNNFSSLAAS